MACGTPVVASDISALREVSAGAATLVPPGDEEALATSIAALVEDRQLHAAARERGLAARVGVRVAQDRVRAVGLRAHAHAPPAAVDQLPAVGARRGRCRRRAGSRGRRRQGLGDPGDGGLRRPLRRRGRRRGSRRAPAWACRSTRPRCAGARGPHRCPSLVSLDAGESVVTLRGREHLVARREEGVRRTAELMQRHERVISALATLPFIRMLALSGGTAHKNARGGDDIDLFVVAAGGRAYTAYTMLFLVSRLTKTRGVVCPNYLVDEDHLEIAYHHDLFTAHQAISMVPIAGMDVFARFVNANDEWIRKLYPGYSPRPPAATLGRPGLQRAFERGVELAGDRLEQLLARGLAAAPRAAGRARDRIGSGARRRHPQAAPVRPPAPRAGSLRAAAAGAARRMGGPIGCARSRAPLGARIDRGSRDFVAQSERFADRRGDRVAVRGDARSGQRVRGGGRDRALLSAQPAFGVCRAEAGVALSSRARSAVAAQLLMLGGSASRRACACRRRWSARSWRCWRPRCSRRWSRQLRGAPGAPYAGLEILRFLAIAGVALSAARAAAIPLWRRRLLASIHVAGRAGVADRAPAAPAAPAPADPDHQRARLDVRQPQRRRRGGRDVDPVRARLAGAGVAARRGRA